MIHPEHATESVQTAQTSTALERLGAVQAMRVCASVGTLLIVAATILVWAAWSSPWLWAQTDGSEAAVDRQMIIARDPSPYEVALLQWPFVCAASMAAAGVLAVIAAFRMRIQASSGRTLLLTAWCLVAYGSFLGLLVGLRWWGFVLARAQDPGPSMLRLGGAPITLIAVGAMGLGVAAAFHWLAPPINGRATFRRLIRLQLALAGTAASGLCLIALLPIARSAQAGSFLYDELTFAAISRVPGHAAYDAASAMGLARTCLWAVFALSSLAWAALRGVPVEMPGRWKLRVAWSSLSVLLPAGALCWSLARAYRSMEQAGQVLEPTPFYVGPIAALLILLGALWLLVSMLLWSRPAIADAPAIEGG